jgi:hypothetical protein
MKKVIAILLLISVSSAARADLADFTQGNLFEPTLVCIGAGAVGYMGAPKGNEAAYAGGACAVGAIVTYFINKHYESKYTKGYQRRIDKLEEAVFQFEKLQGERAANGDEGPYSLRVREVVPAQKLSNGEVSAPTIREKLIVPGSDLRVGE